MQKIKRECFVALPERERLIIYYRFFEEKNNRQIAVLPEWE